MWATISVGVRGALLAATRQFPAVQLPGSLYRETGESCVYLVSILEEGRMLNGAGVAVSSGSREGECDASC